MDAGRGDTQRARQIYTDNIAQGHSRNHYGNTYNYLTCHQSSSCVGLNARGDSDTLNEQGETYYLGAAIMRCDHHAVSQLLGQGANANCKGMKDKTCLRLAIELGHTAIVRALIDAGALVDTTSGDLRAAASLGNCEIVQVLLANSTYAERWQPDCRDALLVACRCGRADIALLLLEKADSAKHASRNGDSTCLGIGPDFKGMYADALRIASGENHHRLVQVMLRRGTMIDFCQQQKMTALQEASSKGHLETVQVLLRGGADINLKAGQYNDNALHLASSQGHADVVTELLTHGADVNARGGRYGNALQAASAKGHNRVVQILIRDHAKVNARGGFQADALQAASSNGHHEVVHTLLSRGAKVNAPGEHYGNALQLASVGGHVGVVNELLAGGANVNARRGRYGTALQAAASQGHHQVVKILIEWGADVNIEGGEHGDALTAAYDSGCKETVLALGGEVLED